MTPQAREAILAADRVVGYLTYLDLIADLIADKEKVGTAMMQEVDRCQQAVDLAIEGHEVVVISSGDSGIYGMAGLVMELANKVPAENAARKWILCRGSVLLMWQRPYWVLHLCTTLPLFL